MAINIPTPVTNTPVIGNESSEMSKEIKNILEERCVSTEFQNFFANISSELNRKCAYKNEITDLKFYTFKKCSMGIEFCSLRTICTELRR